MDKQNANNHVHNGISLRNEKEQDSDIHRNFLVIQLSHIKKKKKP
jgi:hypothetical protein